ncbi:MAG: galactokinase [Treponema sp.]|nr:galactokinase [Treponema sp.]
MLGKELLVRLDSDMARGIFTRLYNTENIETACQRYSSLIEEYLRDKPEWFPHSKFPETGGDIHVFSSPGRTELGGNHTDHNQGKVLAASVQLDAVAIAAPRRDNMVYFRSKGFPDTEIDISDLSMHPDEKGTTAALIRGIAAEFNKRGDPIGGFSANAASQVLPGSGLSSSASLEVLIGKIFDRLYGKGKMSALEIAQIGQKAENNYFGKPCGLMDQVACASGGAVAIDFKDLSSPVVKQVDFNPAALNLALCVVDTGGNHADLTADYAAIPAEMKAVAACLGRNVLRDLDLQAVMDNAAQIRKTAGDRALLRAFHFFAENERVDAMLESMEALNKAAAEEDKQSFLGAFLDQVSSSGNSSWEILQNIYAPHNPREQGISTALALTRIYLKNNCNNSGICRVHGGGFAGTIQAYIPAAAMPGYREYIQSFFGKGSVTVLNIRPAGVVELNF